MIICFSFGQKITNRKRIPTMGNVLNLPTENYVISTNENVLFTNTKI